MSKANLANAILAAPLSDTTTSATLVSGYGAIMPPVPFKMTLTPFGQLSTKGNSEIILVTARTGEVLTIERAKGGTTAKTFEAGDIISNGIYIENSTAVGDIFMSLRTTPAAGRLFMDGGTFNKADYPLLYKCISDNAAYGTTTSTTFTLADMRERMPFGKSSNSPFTTLGYKAGAVSVKLTASDYAHNNWVPNTISGQTVSLNAAIPSGSYFGLKLHSTQSDGQNTSGTNTAHDNMSPYIIVNYEVIAG